MEILFDKNIDIIYGLSYCINREKETLKLYNTKEKNTLLDKFYSIYKNNISSEVKEKISSLGEYHNLAVYAIENNTIDFVDYSIFDDFFNELSKIEKVIINDIKNKNGVKNINIEKIKDFYGFNLSDKVVVTLSLFISGGFGIYLNNTSHIVLGVRYNSVKNEYGVTGTTVSKIYHEFSHPYIAEIIKSQKLKLVTPNEKTLDCYDEGDKTEETLVRAMEIIFSTDVFGKEYLNRALHEQDNYGFKNVRKIVELYLKHTDEIKSMNNFIILLLKENILYNYSN